MGKNRTLQLAAMLLVVLLAGCGSREKRDSDGDGIIDERDQCPSTQQGVIVDENGCPLDFDGDGVPDSLDLCPETPVGTPVDDDGCNEAERTQLDS